MGLIDFDRVRLPVLDVVSANARPLDLNANEREVLADLGMEQLDVVAVSAIALGYERVRGALSRGRELPEGHPLHLRPFTALLGLSAGGAISHG